MTHNQHHAKPEVPVENFTEAVVKWQDHYFVVKSGEWRKVTLISKEAEEDHWERLAIKFGVGIAGFICSLILWSMLHSFFDGAPSTMVGLIVGMVWIMFAGGVVGTLLCISEWLRYRGTVSVAERGSLWGLAEQLGGTPEFIDLDEAEKNNSRPDH